MKRLCGVLVTATCALMLVAMAGSASAADLPSATAKGAEKVAKETERTARFTVRETEKCARVTVRGLRWLV